MQSIGQEFRFWDIENKYVVIREQSQLTIIPLIESKNGSFELNYDDLIGEVIDPPDDGDLQMNQTYRCTPIPGNGNKILPLRDGRFVFYDEQKPFFTLWNPCDHSYRSLLSGFVVCNGDKYRSNLNFQKISLEENDEVSFKYLGFKWDDYGPILLDDGSVAFEAKFKQLKSDKVQYGMLIFDPPFNYNRHSLLLLKTNLCNPYYLKGGGLMMVEKDTEHEGQIKETDVYLPKKA